MEQWLDVADFPLYEVSDQGQVRNKKNRRILKPLDNRRGTMMVILQRSGMGYSRAIRRLVAEAFLPVGEQRGTIAPVHIDNDYKNCAADNLDWRPRWVANERTHQFKRSESMRPGRIQDTRTGQEWDSALVAARSIDGLERYVLTSAFNNTSYKGRYFQFI